MRCLGKKVSLYEEKALEAHMRHCSKQLFCKRALPTCISHHMIECGLSRLTKSNLLTFREGSSLFSEGKTAGFSMDRIRRDMIRLVGTASVLRRNPLQGGCQASVKDLQEYIQTQALFSRENGFLKAARGQGNKEERAETEKPSHTSRE